ncbi:DUF1192 family protein [Brevundimonas aveniformis]|uniref:DUF1192 family protein n=1 Tax=Brevundimonas aveniformis TaxID=370977 RepID=UPI000400BE9C|nr:DUF1192 family protein [Brevundimonas aveniformis]
MIDDLEPRPIRGDALRDLVREDLDGHSVTDLSERVEILKAEIQRTEAAAKAKLQKKSDADALFSFGKTQT